MSAAPTTLGVYEADSSVYKELLIAITQIGTQPVDYDLVFDTGSGGMVIDANGMIPGSMITSTGFNFAGDSTIVNGITITNQTSTIQYGDDFASTSNVYGNLAYAPVTIGDEHGNIAIKRLPFFLYYKATDGKGKVDPLPHDFDTFGVDEEYDATFANNAYVTSPFSYFSPGNGLTSGFKIAALGTSNFSYDGTYSAVLTLGLTTDDLSSSSGFATSLLTYDAGDGYAPIVPGTVTYNNKSFATDVLFDTGTEPDNYLEDPTLSGPSIMLPDSSAVKLTTPFGFNYSYTTTATDNLTLVENPNTSGGGLTIFGIEFFLNNEYLLDFADHKLGVKNN